MSFLGLRLSSRRPDLFKFSGLSRRLRYFSGIIDVTYGTRPLKGNELSLLLTASRASVGSIRDYNFCWFRSFSVMASNVSRFDNSSQVGLRPIASQTQVSEIIELVRRGENNLVTKLNEMNVNLSKTSIDIIFQVLSCEKVSALLFFMWIENWQPEYRNNSDVCSFIVDNCGRLDDFETMLGLLNDFSSRGVCVNGKAFQFLAVIISSKASTGKAISKMIEVLNKAGGSCRSSGIFALIEMFCGLENFEMAKYLIAKTERKLSYYNILIKKKCQIRDFDGAKDILDEMTKVGCPPTPQMFNYILSHLCKNDEMDVALKLIKNMQEKYFPPDALTYEIIIFYFSQHGKLDVALELLGEMASNKIEPRIATHAGLVKGFFKLKQYEEAHKYTVTASDKYKSSSNMLYSLLASLHLKRGNPIVAQTVLSEMMSKGLKPNFAVYRRVKRGLLNSGREDLAQILNSHYSRFNAPSRTESG